ncbi:MAG: response regulator transcription factor [Gammaproteobacteria bacterium]|nr:response regulator transcription factor [Gammaproteobacteria bacterium]
MRIAYLEDDPAQTEMVCGWMTDAGYDYHQFGLAKEFLFALQRETYDLAVLDWELPDMTGDDFLPALRNDLGNDIPVICITVRDSEEDIVNALRLGADDYMCKPVKRGETLARIEALVRRVRAEPETPVMTFAPYDLDTRLRSISLNGHLIDVTQKEFELTLFLFRNAGRLLSRTYILESVWGTRGDLNTRTVDTHVSRIRSKLKLGPEHGWRLRAVYKHGYRLEKLTSDMD